MTSISPLNQNFPIVDKSGYFTSYFKRWADLVLSRIGGINGGVYNTLSSASSVITWDVNASPVAVVTLQSGLNTMPAPLNMVPGQMYRITIIQPASGAAGTISWNAVFKWPGGSAPTLSVTNGYVDEIWFSTDGTNMKGIVAVGDLS